MNKEEGEDKDKNVIIYYYRALEAYVVLSLTQGEEIKIV